MKRFVGRVDDGRLASNPVPERHGQWQLFWRGYISNGEYLLKEAGRRGTRVATGSAGELFSLAYDWWGEALQANVVGEYSLAIFDQRTAELLLTHDSFGLLPMFFKTTSRGVMFGSHLEDLVEGAGFDDLDQDYIADYIADCFYSSERTPYRSVRRLGFGQSVITRSTKIVEKRTWAFGNAKSALANDDAYEERFVALLAEAVSGALAAEAPVWTELSGGLDSSTVAAFGAQAGAKDLEAISLTYSQYTQADESGWMKLVLDRFPMPWNRVDGDAVLPFCELPDRFCAEPGLPMFEWGWHRCREQVVNEAGAAAVLTGQGGDFVLFGLGTEPFYLADLLRTLSLRRLFSELARWQSTDRQRRSKLFWLANYAAGPLMRYMSHPRERPGKRSTMSPWIDARYAKIFALAERVGRVFPGNYESVEQCWFVDTLSKLCGRVANLNQLPASFEFRHPLLNRPLVEFLLSLPSDQKFNPKMNRFLQRRALKSLLPERLRLRNNKTTFDQPFYEGLRKGRQWTELLTTAPKIAELGIVDGPRWLEAVEQAKMGRTHSLSQFQAAATLEIWLRQLIDRPTGGDPNTLRLEAVPGSGEASQP